MLKLPRYQPVAKVNGLLRLLMTAVGPDGCAGVTRGLEELHFGELLLQCFALCAGASKPK